MRRTDASKAKNWDTSHDTALTSDVMNVMNTDISSWTAFTEYPFQKHQHHITRHTETAKPDQAPDTTRKTEKEATSLDPNLDRADITDPAIVT